MREGNAALRSSQGSPVWEMGMGSPSSGQAWPRARSAQLPSCAVARSQASRSLGPGHRLSSHSPLGTGPPPHTILHRDKGGEAPE